MKRIHPAVTCGILVFLYTCSFVIFSTCGQLNLNAHREEISFEYIYRNISHSTITECLQHCLSDCSCLSFQLCGELCQLSLTARSRIPASKIRQSDICTYFNYEDLKSVYVHPENCQHGCSVVFNCCQTSKYCLNNGICIPSTLPSDSKRATCQCVDGFLGDRCEIRAKSCRSFSFGKDGKYTVFDENDQPFPVFCQFKEAVNAWTLVQSYKFGLVSHHRVPYFKNHTRNDATPSWDDYRLSWSRMNAIKQDKNAKWRITCNYDKEGLVFMDYFRTTHAQTPILYIDESVYEGCRQVEHISVKGIWCSNCKVYMAQMQNAIFHVDSYHSELLCQSTISGQSCTNNAGEDNFGYYLCSNQGHSCSSSPEATTQLWFGGRT